MKHADVRPALKGPAPPERVVTLSTTIFKDDYASKPEGPTVRVGIVRASATDYEQARSIALKEADNRYHRVIDPVEWYDAFASKVMCTIAARASCRADDQSKTWMLAAEDNLPLALTPEGVRTIWDEIRRLHREKDITHPIADDVALEDFCRRVRRGELARLPEAEQVAARRYLAWLLIEIKTAPEPTAPALGKSA